MKNISTGTGLCVLGLCLASYPIIDRVMPRAEAGATHVATVVAAATAQVPPEPTIVWYGSSTDSDNFSAIRPVVIRAWSDGRLDDRRIDANASGCACGGNVGCSSQWFQFSSFTDGLQARSDINFDSKVDGSDLAQVLNDWGNVTRQDISPSTCPLNLINP